MTTTTLIQAWAWPAGIVVFLSIFAGADFAPRNYPRFILKAWAIALLWPIAVPVVGCYLLWQDEFKLVECEEGEGDGE